MLEVYEMIKIDTPLIVKIAWYVFAISFFGGIITLLML